MQRDLQELFFSDGEFEGLAGLQRAGNLLYARKWLSDVYRKPKLTKLISWFSRTNPWIRFMCALILHYPIVIIIDNLWQVKPGLLLLFIFYLIDLSILEKYRDQYYDDQSTIKEYGDKITVINLYLEIQKFNNIIKAIDIHDQLAAAGNVSANLRNRSKTLEALALTRKDFVRALKTERILRENRGFITNSSMFDTNLGAIESLSVIDEAGEWNVIINQVVEVALEVNNEIKKLQIE